MTRSYALASFGNARALDAEAAAEWGLDPFALVEAAGRACADVFVRKAGEKRGRIVVLAGSGNNAADALVMLRALVFRGQTNPGAAAALITRLPDAAEKTPLSQAAIALRKSGVSVLEWGGQDAAEMLPAADIVIDGITGTGLDSPLRGAALEMAEAVNALRCASPDAPSSVPRSPFVVSIDTPSGLFDGWRPGMAAVRADAALAIEPLKLCLYTPAARLLAGKILPVGGIFPAALVEKYREAELASWESAAARVPAVPPDAHKYRRGLAEIRAGSPGALGAARLAALGAQSAGAGLVRLIVDSSLYMALASGASGVMVSPDGESVEEGRFKPDAALAGPGWGRGHDRVRLLDAYLPLEAQGFPLILDADAIALARERVFHGSAILTPHAGEFAAYTGLPLEDILAAPLPALRRCALEKNAHILFKSHIMYIVSPDGRAGIVDGMNPALAAGGAGDVLAGICAGIAARMRAADAFDGYACASAAAALLAKAGRAREIAGRFIDPACLAQAAARLAGRAWLPGGSDER